MILHPHLSQLPVAIEVMNHIATIMKAWALQPNQVHRVVEDGKEDNLFVGYRHECRTNDSSLDLDYEVYTESDYGMVFVSVGIVFADNDDCAGSRIILVRYDCSRKEWILSYEKNEKDVDLRASLLADQLSEKLYLAYNENRLLGSYLAFEAIRIIVEFYARYKAEQNS
jgi:hypothetical protein